MFTDLANHLVFRWTIMIAPILLSLFTALILLAIDADFQKISRSIVFVQLFLAPISILLWIYLRSRFTTEPYYFGPKFLHNSKNKIILLSLISFVFFISGYLFLTFIYSEILPQQFQKGFLVGVHTVSIHAAAFSISLMFALEIASNIFGHPNASNLREDSDKKDLRG